MNLCFASSLTGKRKYLSEEAARDYNRAYWYGRAVVPGIQRKMYAYECWACGYWHLSKNSSRSKITIPLSPKTKLDELLDQKIHEFFVARHVR